MNARQEPGQVHLPDLELNRVRCDLSGKDFQRESIRATPRLKVGKVDLPPLFAASNTFCGKLRRYDKLKKLVGHQSRRATSVVLGSNRFS